MQINYDTIIIGGGAAGIMAAISTKRHHPDFSVCIIDRTFALGRKILVCGAGRCNITNLNLNANVSSHYYGASPEFINSVIQQFGYQDIVKFFNDLGIELYVERKTEIGKLFPITNQAKTVTALLEDELQRLNIDVYLNTEVTNISHRENFQIDTVAVDSGKSEESSAAGIATQFNAQHLIISAGGKTYPALGANGSGYKLVESLGHHIITPVPAALPLESKNPLSHFLQGTKMDIEVTSIIAGQPIKTSSDEVLFTQYGLSGPAILNISREISIHINRENKYQAQVKLNFFPGQTKAEVVELLQTRWHKRPDQTLEYSLFGIFPNKIPAVLLQVIGINKDIIVADLSAQQIDQLGENLTNYIVDIQRTRGWNEAEFTAGGVDTNEITPETLQSSKQSNLYLCGEIVDVDGDVGGFNLSWAWSSGYVAGKLGNN